MTKKINPPFIADTRSTQEFAEQLTECATELLRSQLDVTENVYRKLSLEYREMLKSADAPATFQRWPSLLESTIRSTTEGTASLLTNVIGFQDRLIQLTQSKVPELNRQFVRQVIETIEVAKTA